MKDMTVNDFDDACEYIFFSQYNPNLKLKFDPSGVDRAICNAWLNGWVYETCLALDIEWELVSDEFLSQLHEFTIYLQGGGVFSPK
jgi:hypothetical protein